MSGEESIRDRGLSMFILDGDDWIESPQQSYVTIPYNVYECGMQTPYKTLSNPFDQRFLLKCFV